MESTARARAGGARSGRGTTEGRGRPKDPPPDLLPPPLDAGGRPLSHERIKWKLERRLLQEGLSPFDLAFVTATLDLSPGGQLTTASMKTIAKRAGMARSTAFKVRGKLLARGILATDPQDDAAGGCTTNKHAIAAAVFERAGVFFQGPPPSMGWTGPRPQNGHKRDPFSSLDPSSEPGSLDLTENGNNPARGRATPHPVFIEKNGDPAFADLRALHATGHRDQYGREAQRRGDNYDPRDAGNLRPEHHAAIGDYLRGLAARGHAFALARFRDDLTPDAIRYELTERIVRAFLAQDRPYLREHKHPIGCLWGKGSADPARCELMILGERVLEHWCDALDPGEPPRLEDVLERTDRDVARAACAELRTRAAAMAAAGELPPPAVELDHQEHDETIGDDAPEEAPAVELCPPLPRGEVPPRGQRVTAEIRAELERIDADARERAEARRARRSRTRRGGRARLATRPRERLAVLAALMALAAPATPLDEHTADPLDEDPAAAPREGAAPPLLRDARERPARRAPRRRRAPPRRM
jgi:hypothetical protein